MTQAPASQAPAPQDAALDERQRGQGSPLMPLALALLAVAVFAGLFLLGWLPRARQQAALAGETALDAQRPPLVRVTLPTPGKATTALELPGTLLAAQETVLYARSSGYVRSWSVDLGDRVKADQVLAEVAAPELDQQLIQAKAVLAQAQAGIAQARATLALAKLSLERFKTLGPTIATQQDIDSRQADYDTAAANLQLAEAKAQADDADVHRLEQLVGFGRITAPFAGTITLRQIEVGALIAGGGTAAQPLFRLTQTDPLRVVVQVPQDSAQAVHLGIEARVAPRGALGEAVTGRVTRLAHALDAVTRTMRVEIEVPNPDGRILPGMYAQVALVIPNPHPLAMINAAALILSATGPQVAVVDGDQRIHLAPVTIDHDNGAELGISAGIGPGDRVVVNPTGRLAEGTPVEVAAPPAKPAEAAHH
jgi:RND family efflux transporter MFP subunit